MELLRAGKAFADLAAWRKVEVGGTDARRWLNDLVTADVAGLAAGETVPSLLLTPTGGVRSGFTVAAVDDAFLLVQDPRAGEAVDALLDRYVLSSDVEVVDRTGQLALLAFPGLPHPPDIGYGRALRPSCVGRGSDLLLDASEQDRAMNELRDGFGAVGPDGLEAWRVTAGLAVAGVDSGPGDLPQEAGLDDAVAISKGCYLGQEAVAKVRNLGHPRRVLLTLRTGGAARPGDPVVHGGREVGVVTSAAATDGATIVLAKVRWEAREAELATADGAALTPRRA